MVTALIKNSVPPSDTSEGLTLYPPGSTNSEARDSYVQILTDAQFTATVRRTARWVGDNQTQPVWRYFLTYTQSGILSSAGSYHGIELFYVFNNWENAPLGTGSLFTAQDDSMQRNMLAYWVNFAATGNPNGQVLAQWPQYVSSTDPYLEMNATPIGTQIGVRTVKCDFWDQAEGFVTGIENNNNSTLPGNFILFQNYPNPFNPTTIIRFEIPRESIVTIKLYDLLGREIKTLVNEEKTAGSYSYIFDGSSLSSGIYFYRITAGKFAQTKKMILMK
jgi:hypothetical protein